MISLAEWVRKLKKPKLLLVGDLILDHYVTGEVGRISPEAPIPVLDVQSEHYKLGGVGKCRRQRGEHGRKGHLCWYCGK